MSKRKENEYVHGVIKPREIENVTIQDAFEELSPQAFGLWIRLMMINDQNLYGRQRIADLVGYSRSRCDSILKTLKQFGYIQAERFKGPKGTSKFTILKKALISGPNKFVKLSNSIFQTSEGNIQTSGFQHTEIQGFKKMSKNKQKNSLLGAETVHGKRGVTVPKHKRKMYDNEENSELSSVLKNEADADGEKNEGIYKSLIDISKFKSRYMKGKEERSNSLKEGHLRSKCPTKPKIPKWNELADCKDEVFDYSPDAKKRQKLLKILEKSKKDEERVELEEKLAKEFVRVYIRYRRMLQEQKTGKKSSRTYVAPDDEMKFAKKAGTHCLQKSITPVDLLEYWHENVKNFANKRLMIPSLVFLSSPAIADTVACSDMFYENDGGEPVSHSFCNTNKLNRRLRKSLEKAGFSTTKLNDRYLLTIQSTAKSIANGVPLFVGNEIREMVFWVAENFFGKDKK